MRKQIHRGNKTYCQLHDGNWIGPDLKPIPTNTDFRFIIESISTIVFLATVLVCAAKYTEQIKAIF